MTDVGSAISHAQSIAAASRLRHLLEAPRVRERALRDEMHGAIVGDGAVTGFIEVTDIGEAITDVWFPYMFIDEPVFTYGYTLAPSSWPEQTHFPTNSATVVDWYMSGRYFTGAQVTIVVTGTTGQEGKLNYRFEGRSFANPVGGITRVTDPL